MVSALLVLFHQIYVMYMHINAFSHILYHLLRTYTHTKIQMRAYTDHIELYFEGEKRESRVQDCVEISSVKREGSGICRLYAQKTLYHSCFEESSTSRLV